MPSNNSKYTQEIREQTARFIVENGRSATSVAEEMGIDKNTVCSWVREYRRKHDMPSYAEENGLKRKAPQTEGELLYKIKELERKLKRKEKELREEREKVEILKNPCTSLCNHQNEMRSDIYAQLRVLGKEDVQSTGAVREFILSVAEGREEKTGKG